MTGYGSGGHQERKDVKARKANLDETARLVNTTKMTSKEIADRLGVSTLTVTRYRMELIAEGRIPSRRQGRSDGE